MSGDRLLEAKRSKKTECVVLAIGLSRLTEGNIQRDGEEKQQASCLRSESWKRLNCVDEVVLEPGSIYELRETTIRKRQMKSLNSF